MTDVYALALLVLVGVIAHRLHALVSLSQAQAARLERVGDHLTMLFYMVEQVYEMSGVHERFVAGLPAQGRDIGVGFRAKPRTDVDDERSSMAIDTLLQRMQNRMESIVRNQHAHAQHRPFEDADEAMIHYNGEGFAKRVPLPEKWPAYLAPCWFGTGTRPPDNLDRA